jgi:hypothetical protein
LRNGEFVLLKGSNIAPDGFSDVGNRHLFGMALTDAAGQAGALGDPIPIFARVNDDLSHRGSSIKPMISLMHCTVKQNVRGDIALLDLERASEGEAKQETRSFAASFS